MLNGNIINTNENPIPELINDDIYDLLTSRINKWKICQRLFNKKKIQRYA